MHLQIGAVLVAPLAAVVLWRFGELFYRFSTTIHPQRYQATIERNAVPLVQAIRRFEQERGRPPDDLDQLVPHYIVNFPPTDYPADPKYSYYRLPTGGWHLFVHADVTAQSRPDAFDYDSTIGRWAFVPGH